MKTLTPEQARRFYDAFGSWQDTQRFYEDDAVRALERHMRFSAARFVFELGCGTGRFAQELLSRHLPRDARYLGVDLSATMVRLARSRVAAFAERAEVRPQPPGVAVPLPDGAADRFVSLYVLDLLSDEDIAAAVAEAHRVLAPGGRLGLVSLTCGEGRVARAVTAAWQRVFAWRPQLLGGCRPIRLRAHLSDDRFTTVHHEVVQRFGVASEVLVVERR